MHRFGATRLLVVSTAGLTLVLAGCSSHTSSHGRGDNRTVDITMTDNKFQPVDLQATKGETVTFRFRNAGTTTHEAFIGDQSGQDEHHNDMAARKPGTTGTITPGPTPGSTGSTGGTTAAARAEHGHATGVPDDHGHGAGGNEVSVDPGKTGELTYTFNDSGTVIIGCHEPGHWESGMKATVVVA